MSAIGKAKLAAHLLFRNPSYVFGRFHAVRRAYAGASRCSQAVLGAAPMRLGGLFLKETTPVHLSTFPGLRVDTTVEAAVEGVRAKSWAGGFTLEPAVVGRIREFAMTAPLVAPSGPLPSRAGLLAEPEKYRRVALGTVATSHTAPDVRGLAGDDRLHAIATRLLGFQPRRVSSWLFWSFANDLSEDQRRGQYQTIDFHYDVHGFNFLYVSFYLVDTTARNGAHVLIEGSHGPKSLRHLLGSARIGDAEAIAAYGERAVVTVEAPAGTGFVEDTSCYHKALTPLEGERLMLQLRYQ